MTIPTGRIDLYIDCSKWSRYVVHNPMSVLTMCARLTMVTLCLDILAEEPLGVADPWYRSGVCQIPTERVISILNPLYCPMAYLDTSAFRLT